MASLGNMITGTGGTDISNPVNQAQLDASYNNTQTGLQQQQDFLHALQGQNGIQNQSDVYNKLGAVADGTGPNPAAAMLANSTGANVANQASLAAGQRGAGANTGLIARQAGMQGGALQQQAAGQGAAMQANQSLNALGQQGQMAGQMVNNQGNAANAYTQGALNQSGQLLGAQSNFNNAKIANQSNIDAQGKAILGAAAQAGSAGAAGAGGGGGAAKAHGGFISESEVAPKHTAQSFVAQHLLKMASGGVVPVMVSPGEAYVPPEKVQAVAKGESPRSAGTVIPGKPKVKGDSLKNDTVPTKLETGGVVIPRTQMESDDKASKFVQALLAKNSMKSKGKK